MDPGDPDAAQARLQARHGARPSELQWRRLEAAQGLAPFLEMARREPFGAWLVELDDERELHAIDAALAARFAAMVREVAGWFPPASRAPIEQLASLPGLPLRRHLAHGGAVEAWMSRAVAGAGTAAGIDPASADLDVLLERWNSRWPDAPEAGVGQEARQFVATVRAMRAALRLPPGRDRGQRLSRLQGGLDVLFRRSAGTPVAACIELFEVATGMLRLRAGLVRRVLEERAVSVAT